MKLFAWHCFPNMKKCPVCIDLVHKKNISPKLSTSAPFSYTATIALLKIPKGGGHWNIRNIVEYNVFKILTKRSSITAERFSFTYQNVLQFFFGSTLVIIWCRSVYPSQNFVTFEAKFLTFRYVFFPAFLAFVTFSFGFIVIFIQNLHDVLMHI